MKTNIGWLLLILGAAGMLNNVLLMQAMSTGSAPSGMLNAIDPATILKITNGQGGISYTSPTMLTDAGIAALGGYLVFG